MATSSGSSMIPDLRGVSLPELVGMDAGPADEVTGLLARVIDSADDPSQVSVTAFNSSI